MGKHFINLINIYRPPYSSKHPFTVKDFLLEFDQLLSYTLELKEHFLLFGDLNINCSDLKNQNTKDLLSLLKTYNLNQLVTGPTHTQGSLLDLIIADENISKLDSKAVTSYDFKTDHFPVK